MSVRIRLSRQGRRGKPFFRIVVMEKRTKRGGRTLATLGFYDPQFNPPKLKVDKEKLTLWLKNGAEPSESLRKLLTL